MGTSSKMLHENLRATAIPQNGFFTSKQAVEAGYADSVHNYHVANGDWVKVYRGIYRLSEVPPPEWPELTVWTLWSRGRDGLPQGVLACETALAIHGHIPREGDVMHLIVPKAFRRNSEIPEQLRIYKEDLEAADIEDRGAFRVTTMARTIRDLMEHCTNPKILQRIAALSPKEAKAESPGADGPEVTHWPEWDYVWAGPVGVSGWGPGKTFEDAIQAGED
jgi:predicted transcriptional regulator of viral defense system